MANDLNTTGLDSSAQKDVKAELESRFEAEYGMSDNPIITVAAPARVNIIGEHIDYNGGLVLPAAIDRYLYVLVRKRHDTKIVYNDLVFPDHFEFDSADDFRFDKKNGYANYLNGILSILRHRGCLFTSGFDVLIFSKIPAGGGLSSSAALEIGFGLAVSQLFGFPLTGIDLAKIGQEAEHRFMNVHCGIMDQFSIAMGKKHHALLLNTASLEYEIIPFRLKKYDLVVMNSNKSRRLADSKYNERRQECDKALASLRTVRPHVPNLCGLSETEFAELHAVFDSAVIRRRAQHCISEHARVKKAVQALADGDEEKLGEILTASHVSLRDNYEVTGMELDALVTAAVSHPFCCGARMTGAGFGGCAIALVKKEHVQEFSQAVSSEYTLRTGLAPGFFVCTAGNGAYTV